GFLQDRFHVQIDTFIDTFGPGLVHRYHGEATFAVGRPGRRGGRSRTGAACGPRSSRAVRSGSATPSTRSEPEDECEVVVVMTPEVPRSPLVGVVMGSKSDWETMRHAAEVLTELGVPVES